MKPNIGQFIHEFTNDQNETRYAVGDWNDYAGEYQWPTSADDGPGRAETRKGDKMSRKLFAVLGIAMVVMSALPMAVSADDTISYVHGNDQQAWWRVCDMVYAPFFETTNALHWGGAWQFPDRWIEYDGNLYDAGDWPEYTMILEHLYYLNGSDNCSTEIEYALTGNIGMLQTRAYEALVIINDQAIDPMSHAELMALAHAMYTPEYVRRMSRLARVVMNGCAFVTP